MDVFLQSAFERSGYRFACRRRDLKSLAGVGVAYPRHEEAKAEGQHDDIQHEMLLVARVSQLLRVFREGIAMDQDMELRS